MTFDMPDTGAGRQMRHPYGVLGKLFSFPYKHYWKHGRGFRYLVISVIACVPIIYPIHKAVNSPGNLEAWAKIRAKRPHDPFALPTLDGKHH